jgi:serine protease Do
MPTLGFSIAPADSVEGARSLGVVVTEVSPDGPAAQRGLQVGDRILSVGGKEVSKPADVRHELAQLQKEGKQSVLMRLKSGQSTRFVALPLHRA